MNDTPEPQILPQSQKPPVWGPVYSPGNQNAGRRSVSPIVIIIGVIFILIVGSLVFAVSRPKQTTIVPTPAPTILPSATPIQALSPFATQSAFVSFDQSVDALPQTISQTTISDQSLAPPSVDLTLGFQK